MAWRIALALNLPSTPAPPAAPAAPAAAGAGAAGAAGAAAAAGPEVPAAAAAPAAPVIVLHVCGSAHCEHRLGIPEHLGRYAPGAKVAVVLISPTAR